MGGELAPQGREPAPPPLPGLPGPVKPPIIWSETAAVREFSALASRSWDDLGESEVRTCSINPALLSDRDVGDLEKWSRRCGITMVRHVSGELLAGLRFLICRQPLDMEGNPAPWQ